MKLTETFLPKFQYRAPTNEELKTNPSILGVITGEHFCPEGFSRNRRFYPENDEHGRLWKTQLESTEFQEKLQNNQFLGTIGHDLELNDKTLREGMFSHFTTNHEIRETNDPKKPYIGYAESFIIDTPTGRVLKAYSEARVNLFTSTRADGTYLKGKTKKNEKGEDVPILDPETYKYERNDMVLAPGFLSANPKLKEELGDQLVHSINEAYEQGDLNMDVTKDNELKTPKDPKSPPGTALPANKGDTASKDAAPDKDQKPKDTDLDNKEQKTTDVPVPKVDPQPAKESASEKLVADLMTKVESYEVLGTPEQIKEALKKALKAQESEDGDDDDKEDDSDPKDPEAKDDEDGEVPDSKKESEDEDPEGDDDEDEPEDKEESLLSEFGTPDEIREVLTTVKVFFEEVGDPSKIREALEAAKIKAEEYSSLGSVDEIKSALNEACEFFSKHGKLKSLEETLAKVNKLGSLDNVEKKLEGITKLERENLARRISERTDVDVDKVIEKLNEGMSEKSIIEFYKSLNSSAADKYMFTSSSIDEDVKPAKAWESNSTPRLSRILNKLS